jgi:hypothetical protein
MTHVDFIAYISAGGYIDPPLRHDIDNFIGRNEINDNTAVGADGSIRPRRDGDESVAVTSWAHR